MTCKGFLRLWLYRAGVWPAGLSAAALLISCGAAEEPGQEPAEEVGEGAPAASLGEITTYAGTGSPKFKVDGGPAIEAGFFAPSGVALDREGNLYIAADKRILKVDAGTAIATTVAGSGSSLRGFGDHGPALDAGFLVIRGLAVDDAGNLYISDNGSGRIRKVDSATGIITTVAGGGAGDPLHKIFGDGGLATEALVKLPDDVAVDADGNLYIATDNRIRKVDAASGVIDTIAGTGERGVEGDGGPATSAGMAEPVSVAVDAQGNVFIVDSENHRVRKVAAATGIITTIAGIGRHYTRTPAAYQSPDYGTRSKAAATGAGYAGDGGPANQAMLQTPSAIGLDGDGNMFIADGGVRVRRIDGTTGVITTVAAGEVERTDKTGKVQILTTTLAEIVSLAVNGQGEIFLADFKMNVVHKVSAPSSP